MSNSDSTLHKKKIFICADYFSPGYKAGGPIQSLSNFIEKLVGKFDIYIVTRNYDWGDSEVYNLPVNEWIQNNQRKICYMSNILLTYENIKEKIKEIKPDFVYLNSLYSPLSRFVLKFFF